MLKHISNTTFSTILERVTVGLLCLDGLDTERFVVNLEFLDNNLVHFKVNMISRYYS